jgi:hypothetical protein
VFGDLLGALRLDPTDRRKWVAEEKNRQQHRLYSTPAPSFKVGNGRQ